MRNRSAGFLALALAAVAPAGCGNELGGTELGEGSWGGDHIHMDVMESGALLEYDCAHGTMDLPASPIGERDFEAGGTHTIETGGPEVEGEPPDTHPARYRGSVLRDRLTLTVTILDLDQTLGPFVLTRNDPGRVFKCQ